MKEWIKWLILGLLSALFGVFVLGNAVVATLAVTTLAGALFVISGGFQIAAGLTGETGMSRVFSVLLGGLMALLGLSILAHPLEGMISLTMLILVLLAASGIVRLVQGFGMKNTPYFWPMLLSGAFSIFLAGYIGANFAAATLTLLGIIMGVELLLNGLGMIVLAFFARSARPT